VRPFTYLALNLVFLLIAYLLVRRLKRPVADQILIITVIAYSAMVVFNSYLTSIPIVRYDWSRVIGLKLVSWPIEDVAYLVVALYLVPALYGAYMDYFSHAKKITRPQSKLSSVAKKSSIKQSD